jgi:hypothetical protein
MHMLSRLIYSLVLVHRRSDISPMMDRSVADTSLDLCEMLFQCTLSLHTSLLQHLYSSLHTQRIENARVTRVQTRSSFLLAG